MLPVYFRSLYTFAVSICVGVNIVDDLIGKKEVSAGWTSTYKNVTAVVLFLDTVRAYVSNGYQSIQKSVCQPILS